MDIPISFSWQSKEFVGYFSEPHGSGGNVWFLTVNKYHWAQLILTQNHGWQFHNTKDEMKEIAVFWVIALLRGMNEENIFQTFYT